MLFRSDGVTRVTPQAAEEPDLTAFELLAARDVRRDVFDLVVAQGLRIWELQKERSTLEEVFRRLTGSAEDQEGKQPQGDQPADHDQDGRQA